MNVFSSTPFLRAIAETYFPDQRAEIAVHNVDGHSFQLLRVGKKTITSSPMVDFWEPLTTALVAADPSVAVYPLRSLPRVALTSAAFTGEPLALHGVSASPYTDLRRFATWEDLQGFVRGRRKKVYRDSARQLRRLESEVGPARFALEDDTDEAIDRCVAWRSERFRSAARMHRDPRHALFMRTVRDRGVARVSSLRAGGQLVAAVLGLPYEGRYSYWIVGYDGAFGVYSPGRLLLEHVIAGSVANGDVEFDFLVGSESYKWMYATHARLVGPLGPQPAVHSAVMAARRRLRLGRKYLKLRKALGR
jgi:CelD/BcsL family acetyltransferase involved in cellulose biosynthesis